MNIDEVRKLFPTPAAGPSWKLTLWCECGWVHTDGSPNVAMNPSLARDQAVDAYRTHCAKDHSDSWENLAKDLLAHAGNISGKPCGSNCGICGRLDKLRERAKRLGEVTR